MRARHPFAALCVSIFTFLILAGVAQAAGPTTVNVRIEGATETLFEGPVSAAPHNVEASSDTVERPCDGINSLDPWNTAPGVTPTSSSVDAMSLIGETFDGKWYPGFNDYFITRFGPDAEKEGKSWGILVNNVFTNVGGCQYQLDEGDEVLWVFNAFNYRPFLALFPAGYPSGSRPLTATATLGQPFEVEVVSYEDDSEDVPPDHPERTGSAGFEGADVSPVATNAKGFEKVEVGSTETVATNSQGKATITFTTPGWHRIKATVPGATEEEAIRSNRLDVCVPALGETGCGALPAEDEVRVPRATIEARETEERVARERREREEAEAAEKARAASSTPGQSTPSTSTSTATPGPVRVSVPKVDRKKLRQGRVVLSWKVLEAGAGVKGWSISSRTIGAKKAAYVKRASGTTATSATLRLPHGAYRLRFTVTDALGRTSSVTIGKVVVPGGRRG
jgi:sRNA-binding protein